MDRKQLAAAGNSHNFEARKTSNANLTEAERQSVLLEIFDSSILGGNFQRWPELLQTESGLSD